MLSGVQKIFIELTSRCGKRTRCAFCSHQRPDIHTGRTDGDMDFALLQALRAQLHPGVTIAFHRDGEPTDYPRLREALDLFDGFFVNIITHGERLIERAQDLIGRCTVVVVSCFKGDPDHARQFSILREFLQLKGEQLPRVAVKIVGDYPDHPYDTLGVPVIHRLIHSPLQQFRYAHRAPTVPEEMTCLDALHKPSVNWQGEVFLCNRMDATKSTKIGDLTTQTLDEIWNGDPRKGWVAAHRSGHRGHAADLCTTCTFYGVPSA